MTEIEEILKEEREELKDTELCRNATNFVTLRGSRDPRFVFVGEAPGAEEDKQGKPFVGRAGKLLDDWIEGLGFEESEYAITNVVNCRPPENRTPTKKESEKFGEWLWKELEALEPDFIFPLGKTATEFLLPKTRNMPFLKGACYSAFNSDHGKVIPLPHPAYALRNGGFPLPYEEIKEEMKKERSKKSLEDFV
ncbi:MAG: uracil-DNA glycosylase [Candidatus Nanohaloarchaea archaeon]|nr:uracil-DNA glycosylase [Candidatus Nanohaloarchaea archaeon]